MALWTMITTPLLIPLREQLDTGDYNLFKAIETVPNYQNVFGDMSADELNLQYLYNHSGFKYCSPLLRNMAKSNENEHITSEQLTQLAGIIYHQYNRKWRALWETYVVDYNPIENYNMTEETENSGTQTSNETGDSTVTYGKTTNTTDTATGENTTTVKYGEDVTTLNTTSQSGSDTTDTDATQTTTYGKQTNSDSSVKHTGTDTTTSENTQDMDYGKVNTTSDTTTHTGTDTENTAINITKGDNGTVTNDESFTHGKKSVSESNGNATQNNSVWGFNSTENPVATDRAIGDNSVNETVTDSGTDNDKKTETRALTATESGNNDITKTYNTTEKRDVSVTDSGKDTITTTGNETITHDTTDTTSETVIDSGSDSIKNIGTNTITHDTKEVLDGSVIHGGQDETKANSSTTQTGSVTSGGSDKTVTTNENTQTTSGKSTLKRSGNIGVTTTQQMLQQERELWLVDYYDTIFSDIDSVIALSVY